MFFIEYIFTWSEKIVDLLIGSLLKLVTWILQLIGQGFTYLIGQTSTTSATHGALLFLAFVLVIGLGIIAVYLSPLLAVGLFIFLPLTLIALKYTLGWVVLFGITYFAYRMIKKLIHSIIYFFKAKEATE
ncbi:TPA: hypothetical protein IUU68_002496 [Enterococcus faecalis]|uniref:Phage holin family protein n=1 Tax=Enterococcus faecalis TaxID=1351 RepID=A0ABD7XT10_ENTFL|nr:hypothetical protein [Enterococcus faecalis]MCU2226085.1 hypothetical protein [Enterococcus faecalis]WER44445.1 hypothetical protein P0083_16460 [Enterococcus faecalis]HAP4004093.1 hypothetical protein [Enterococcus faecalis]HAP4022799.1 hypothetical protein [Enterococcus faecalis]HAP4113275.1 hypothetical protein [Enterococcus faecalis]